MPLVVVAVVADSPSFLSSCPCRSQQSEWCWWQERQQHVGVSIASAVQPAAGVAEPAGAVPATAGPAGAGPAASKAAVAKIQITLLRAIHLKE